MWDNRLKFAVCIGKIGLDILMTRIPASVENWASTGFQHFESSFRNISDRKIRYQAKARFPQQSWKAIHKEMEVPGNTKEKARHSVARVCKCKRR